MEPRLRKITLNVLSVLIVIYIFWSNKSVYETD